MLLTRYKRPTKSFDRYKSFDLFNEFLNNFDVPNETNNLSEFSPTVNTREGKEAYHIEVDLPGIKKEDVDVKVEDNVLVISGKREFQEEVKEENYYKIESSYGNFSRSFSLPQKIDIENIKANSEDGVLEVIIPKLKVIDNNVKNIEIK